MQHILSSGISGGGVSSGLDCRLLLCAKSSASSSSTIVSCADGARSEGVACAAGCTSIQAGTVPFPVPFPGGLLRARLCVSSSGSGEEDVARTSASHGRGTGAVLRREKNDAASAGCGRAFVLEGPEGLVELREG